MKLTKKSENYQSQGLPSEFIFSCLHENPFFFSKCIVLRHKFKPKLQRLNKTNEKKTKQKKAKAERKHQLGETNKKIKFRSRKLL